MTRGSCSPRRWPPRILEYRQKNGGFKKIEDLMEILQLAQSSGAL